MANRQEIDLGVNMSPTEDGLNKAADAADGLTDNLGKAADAADAAAAAVSTIGPAAANSQKDLSALTDMLNDFLVRRAQATGKTPKLFDAGADVAALGNIRDAFEQLVKDTKALPNGIGNKLGVTGQGGVKSPEQINFDRLDGSAKEQQRLKDNLVLSLLRRAQAKGPIDVGLTANELQGKGASTTSVLPPAPPPGAGSPKPPTPPKPPAPSEPDEERRRRIGAMAHAGRYLLGRTAAGAGEGGQLIGEAAKGAGAGLLGGMPGGLLGGAAIGVLGFGAYKGAQAINEGMDRSKAEAHEIDRFKRSMGDLGQGFDALKEQTRSVGAGFSLTFEQSRKLAMEFARVALVRDDADPRRTRAQTREGIGMAQAFGIDESMGVNAVGSLRHDQSIGQTQRDARIFGVQIAEALKRTGSTLNAPDVLQAIMAYSRESVSRSLAPTNTGAYAGMLSAMAGSGTAGLDTRNAANIIGRADSAFRSGGGMGEASNTLQYMALGGDKLGVGLTSALQEGGLFATRSSTFGSRKDASGRETNQTAKFYGDHGVDITGIKGDETNLEALMKTIDQHTNSKDPALKQRILQSVTTLGPQQAMTLYNMRNAGQLDETVKLASRAGVDLDGMSATGYDKLAELAINRKTPEQMQAFRGDLLKRTDLDEGQKSKLQSLGSETDGDKLRLGLAQVVGTLEREKNLGQQIQDNTAKTANAVQKMGDSLLPITTKMRDYLGALVSRLAPESKEAKELKAQEDVEQRMRDRGQSESGSMTDEQVKKANEKFDGEFRGAAHIYDRRKREKALVDIEERRRETLGPGAIPAQPVDIGGGIKVGLSDKELAEARARADARTQNTRIQAGETKEINTSGGAAGAIKFFQGKGWSHANAAGLAASLKIESNFDPKAIGDNGKAHGIAQWSGDRQREFEKFTGKPVLEATEKEQLEFLHYEITQGKEKAGGDKLRAAKTPYDSGAAVSRYIERPYATNREIATRGQLAESYAAQIPDSGATRPAPVVPTPAQIEKSKAGGNAAAPGPAKIPEDDPLRKAEEKKVSDAQRMQVEFGQINFRAELAMLAQPGQQAQPVTVVSGVVRKPVATGTAWA